MRRRWALLVCLFAVPGLVAPAGPAAAQLRAVAPTAPISWLSTGDSFSSGEGISGTGVGEDKCAQSSLSYGPRALKLLQTQRSFSVGTMAFSACTGHLTGDFYNEHQISTGVGSGLGSLWKWTQEQAGEGAAFDAVTFSFGGNDLRFPELMRDCVDVDLPPESWALIVRDGCQPSQDELVARVDGLLAGDPPHPLALEFGPNNSNYSLAGFYELVARNQVKPGGVLIVVGYPRLVAPTKDWPAWRGTMCQRIWDSDADTLDAATVHLDKQLSRAVAQARGELTDGRSIEYVSRLELFDEGGGHSLCSPSGSEWVNGISLGTSSGLRLAHSFHPNERGHQRTAEKVAEIAAKHLQVPGGPPSVAAPATTPPAIRDPEPRYEVGSDFDADCINAWPTAPSYTSTSIILTMSCPSVSGQFLFVQVTYPDPDLPITPSTGSVQVHGEVVDVVRSAYGFTTLVVQAEEVQIP